MIESLLSPIEDAIVVHNSEFLFTLFVGDNKNSKISILCSFDKEENRIVIISSMIYQKTYKVFNSFEGVRFNSNETLFKLLTIDKNDKIDFETGKIIKSKQTKSQTISELFDFIYKLFKRNNVIFEQSDILNLEYFLYLDKIFQDKRRNNQEIKSNRYPKIKQKILNHFY